MSKLCECVCEACTGIGVPHPVHRKGHMFHGGSVSDIEIDQGEVKMGSVPLLAEACDILRCSRTGMGDPYPEETENALVDYLERRLKYWTSVQDEYQISYKLLVLSTLALYPKK